MHTLGEASLRFSYMTCPFKALSGNQARCLLEIRHCAHAAPYSPPPLVQPELELTQEVLSLAEFGLQSLEQYSRQEALSSVGMQF